MAHRIAAVALCALALLASKQANAWFFFWIPTGAIVRALETKPEEISVSYQDRSLGKCGGYHFNQAYRFSDTWGNPNAFVADGNSAPAVEESAESKFHKAMAERSVEKSSEQGKVKNLAEAYSTAWGRAAEGGFDANRAYGSDLAGACVQNGIAVNLASSKAQEAANERMQSDEHTKRRDAEYERNRQAWEEKERREKAEESARLAEQAKNMTRTTSQSASGSSSEIDFSAEAKKSALILGCKSSNVRVIGTERRNILFGADCQNGTALTLTCRPDGLCLKKQ